MSSRLRLVIPALRELGIGALYDYAAYRMALRSGWLKQRTPSYSWTDRPLTYWLRSDLSPEQALRLQESFFFGSQSSGSKSGPSQALNRTQAVEQADELLGGKFRLFGGPPVDLGNPPKWGDIPLDDENPVLPLDRHWTDYDTEGTYDLRLLWEPARFGWVFTLCRAYRLTGKSRYASGTLALINSWKEASPPNTGPHWISGQEIALRAMALTFARYALGDYVGSEGQRAADLLSTIAAHAERLPVTLRFARAQRNNHLLTEAAAMYTVGLLFPSLRQSRNWRREGRRWLITALEDQVFLDGGYVQYSNNYQRLALSAGLWAARLAEINDDPLPETTIHALSLMTTFLITLTNPLSGRVPNWGHNDGSDILPLSSARVDDYRPVLQAAALAFLGGPAYPPGEWDELAVWLGLEAGAGDVHGDAGQETDFPQAGLYLLNGEDSRTALRCVRFAARPAHSDQLHVDLWWQNENIARDGGSYRYSAPDPWANALATARAHNTLTVDDVEPMLSAGKFLWLNWSNARLLGRWQAEDGSLEAVAAEHAMKTGTRHRRSVVRAGASVWVVLDELLGEGAHQARVAWSLVDLPWEFEGQRLSLSSEHGPIRLSFAQELDTLALYRAGERVAGEGHTGEDPTVLGWWSPTYGYKEPALTLVAAAKGTLPLRVTSWWHLGDVEAFALEWGSLEKDPLMAFLSTGQDP